MPQQPANTDHALEAINLVVGAFSQTLSPDGMVIEIGSHYQPGHEDSNDRRKFFQGKEYIGCDLRAGLGVDRIEDAYSLSFSDGSVGTLLMLDTAEHMAEPEKAISEAFRVLRDDGALLISVPFDYPLHGFPTDYWRFTASGMYTMLSEFPEKFVFAVGPTVKPATVFGIAMKSRSDAINGKVAMFRSLLRDSEQRLRRHLFIAALHRRTRDFFGLLLGRAAVGVSYFDPERRGGYSKSD